MRQRPKGCSLTSIWFLFTSSCHFYFVIGSQMAFPAPGNLIRVQCDTSTDAWASLPGPRPGRPAVGAATVMFSPQYALSHALCRSCTV